VNWGKKRGKISEELAVLENREETGI
jgi:hypothetical protein